MASQEGTGADQGGDAGAATGMGRGCEQHAPDDGPGDGQEDALPERQPEERHQGGARREDKETDTEARPEDEEVERTEDPEGGRHGVHPPLWGPPQTEHRVANASRYISDCGVGWGAQVRVTSRSSRISCTNASTR